MTRLYTEAELRAIIVADLRRAGIEEELIYAFGKTGRIVSDENIDQLSLEEITEWEQAIAEYRAQNPSQKKASQ